MREFVRARSDALLHSARGERRGLQIGPRIRVGGTVGKIGQNIKIGTGKVLSNPIAQGIIGATLGPGAAAAAGGLGRALDTTNGGSGIGDIALSGLKGYGAGKVGQVVKGVGSGIKAGFDAGGVTGALKAGVGKLPLSGLVGGAGGDGGFDLGNLGTLASGAIGAYQVGKERDAADALTNRGLDTAHQAYDAKAPLRQMALSQLLNPTHTNLAGRFATNAHNPFAKGGG